MVVDDDRFRPELSVRVKVKELIYPARDELRSRVLHSFGLLAKDIVNEDDLCLPLGRIAGQPQCRGMTMGKRPKKRDYSDKTCIDMNAPYQVAYWKQRFGLSDQELKDAVRVVGTSVKKIEDYLSDRAAGLPQ